jgi:hypothetical protein
VAVRRRVVLVPTHPPHRPDLQSMPTKSPPRSWTRSPTPPEPSRNYESPPSATAPDYRTTRCNWECQCGPPRRFRSGQPGRSCDKSNPGQSQDSERGKSPTILKVGRVPSRLSLPRNT